MEKGIVMPVGVYKRTEKHLEQMRKKAKKPRSLRGGGYYAIHKWLAKNYGKADICDNPYCKGKSKTFQWAKLKGYEYEYKRENFMRMCAKCHRNYDDTQERIDRMTKTKTGKKHTEEHKAKIRASCKGTNIGNKHSAKKVIQLDKDGVFIKVWDCISDAAKYFNTSNGNIYSVLEGKTKTAKGFKWVRV